MAIVPLTNAQNRAVEALVDQRRLERVVPDQARALVFLERARGAVEDVGRLTQPHTAYNVAYDACHDVGEALLAAYGYRTRSGVGQHDALGKFLVVVLAGPPGADAAVRCDQLRRARNKNRYDAAPIGAAQVAMATQAARTLVDAAAARGIK